MKSIGSMCSWCSVWAIPALALLGCSFEEGSEEAAPLSSVSEGTEEVCVLDKLSVTVEGSTRETIEIQVCAGYSGAPEGYTVEWGSECSAWFGPLGKDECENLLLGDLVGVCDKCGDLECGKEYEIRARAEASCKCEASDYSCPVKGSTLECEDEGNGCTLTQGYWKNHPDAWPVNSLMLGSVNYTASQLLDILKTPPAGNGLIQLAHQLIAAKLNVADGASSSDVAGDIAAADALINGRVVPPVGTGYLPPGVTSSLIDELDDYNEGRDGPGHCEDNEDENKDERSKSKSRSKD